MDRRIPTDWQELTPRQRQAIVAVGVITTLWQVWMLWDLRRRAPDQVRGRKRWWVLASFVRPVGQLAYHVWGRVDDAPSAAHEGWFDDVGRDELAG